jgi:hypothetical protein
MAVIFLHGFTSASNEIVKRRRRRRRREKGLPLRQMLYNFSKN